MTNVTTLRGSVALDAPSSLHIVYVEIIMIKSVENTDGSFTTAASNSFLGRLEKSYCGRSGII